MSGFVNLHVHSEYSAMDGVSTCKELVKRAGVLGQKAVALTDHDGLYGAVDLCENAVSAGVRPIIGCELRFVLDTAEKVRGWHITALALTEQGYRNLCDLVTEAYRPSNFYHHPRVPLSSLLEKQEGLCLLSGCWFGYPGQLYEKALSGSDSMNTFSEITSALHGSYGERFLFELFTGDYEHSQDVVKFLVDASAKWGIKTVATNDTHFASPEDWHRANLLRSIRLKGSDGDGATMPRHQYLMSEQEMRSLLPEEAVDNTVMVADWARHSLDLAIDSEGHVLLEKVLQRLPRPPISEGETEWGAFINALQLGWQKRMGFLEADQQEAYHDRLLQEVEVFKQTGLAGYMLIVAEMTKYCAQNNILRGPGRGSASGSLCSFLLGITDLDPIASGLFFERFLDPRRASMPDIDVDYDPEDRERVFAYLQRTYGADHVARILTFQRLVGSSAIKDVGSLMGVSYDELNKLTSAIEDFDELDVTAGAEQSDKNKEALGVIAQNPDLANVVQQAKLISANEKTKSKGAIRQVGAHAAGVVIAPYPIRYLSPTQLTKRDSNLEVFQWDMSSVDKMGLLKIDVLNVRTLGVARDVIDLVRKRHGVQLDWYSIPVYDEKAYEMAGRGRTTAIFQLEKRTAQEPLKKIKPNSLLDLAVVLALNRPGPMAYMDEYAICKNDPSQITYDLAEWEPVLRETYGIMVYQEQVIQALQALGFSFTEADDFRRGMAKKKQSLIDEAKAKVIPEIVKRGYQQFHAEAVWEKIEKFGGYAFNKAHAVAYACISARMLWLKTHYPAEFMAGVLTSQEKEDFFMSYIEEVSRLGLRLLPPDINLAGESFVPSDGAVRFGFSQIQYVGSLAKAIVAGRLVRPRGWRGPDPEEGVYPYQDPVDFCRRMKDYGMNRRQFLALIWAGSFDDFCLSRSFLADNAEKLMGVAKAGRVSVEALVTWEDLIAGVEMKADDEDMIADKELELLKCSPRRMAQDIGLRDRIGKGTVALSQLEPSSKNVRVCGRILEIGKRSGKKSDYAYLQLNDGTALLRCLAFKENVIDQLEEIGPQAAVVLQGDASEDGSAFFIRKVVNSYSDDKG